MTKELRLNMILTVFYVSVCEEDAAGDPNGVTYAIVVTKPRKDKGLLHFTFNFLFLNIV